MDTGLLTNHFIHIRILGLQRKITNHNTRKFHSPSCTVTRNETNKRWIQLAGNKQNNTHCYALAYAMFEYRKAARAFIFIMDLSHVVRHKILQYILH